MPSKLLVSSMYQKMRNWDFNFNDQAMKNALAHVGNVAYSTFLRLGIPIIQIFYFLIEYILTACRKNNARSLSVSEILNGSHYS